METAVLKIAAAEWIEVPPLISAGIIALLLGGAIWASLRVRNQVEHEPR